MAKAFGQVVIEIDKCKGCELCIAGCPENTLGLANALNKLGYQYAVMVQDNCTGCGNCALLCPEAIISVYRKIVK